MVPSLLTHSGIVGLKSWIDKYHPELRVAIIDPVIDYFFLNPPDKQGEFFNLFNTYSKQSQFHLLYEHQEIFDIAYGFLGRYIEKAKPKFLGKDENGKPIFSGKTGERNHYWDGKPRTDEEKANKTPFGSKPKFYGKSDMPQQQAKKSYNPDVKKEYTKRPGKRISVKSLEPKNSGNE